MKIVLLTPAPYFQVRCKSIEVAGKPEPSLCSIASPASLAALARLSTQWAPSTENQSLQLDRSSVLHSRWSQTLALLAEESLSVWVVSWFFTLPFYLGRLQSFNNFNLSSIKNPCQVSTNLFEARHLRWSNQGVHRYVPRGTSRFLELLGACAVPLRLPDFWSYWY